MNSKGVKREREKEREREGGIVRGREREGEKKEGGLSADVMLVNQRLNDTHLRETSVH